MTDSRNTLTETTCISISSIIYAFFCAGPLRSVECKQPIDVYQREARNLSVPIISEPLAIGRPDLIFQMVYLQALAATLGAIDS